MADTIEFPTLLKRLNKEFKEFICDTTHIFLANNLDLIELDMSKIPKNVIFISDSNMKRGEVLEIIDKELKYEIYGWVINNNGIYFYGTME
jgi:hypothetical protein